MRDGNGILADLMAEYEEIRSEETFVQLMDGFMIRMNQDGDVYVPETEDEDSDIITAYISDPEDPETEKIPMSVLVSAVLDTENATGIRLTTGELSVVLKERTLNIIREANENATGSRFFLRHGGVGTSGCEAQAEWSEDVFRGFTDPEDRYTRCIAVCGQLLEAAKRKDVHAIALAAVSQEISGLPLADTAEAILAGCSDWFENNPAYSMIVEFCCETEGQYRAFHSLMYYEEELTEEEETLVRLKNAASALDLSGTAFDVDSIYSFWYLGEHYDSVAEYEHKMQETLTTVLRERAAAVWVRIRTMAILRATRAKIMQNPELMLSLIQSGFAIRSSKDLLTDRVLMVIRRELNLMLSCSDVEIDPDGDALLTWAQDRAAEATDKHVEYRAVFDETENERVKALGELKLAEIAQLPDGEALIQPFALVMENLKPDAVGTADAFVAHAPRLMDVAASVGRKKGMPVPESLEMLYELAEAAEYGRI